MNIYAILEQLRKRRNPVFTVSEIARASNLAKSCAIVYIKRMIDKGLLIRVAKGIYTLDNDPILYASYIIPNSYISFNSALYIHKVIDQIPTSIQVAVPKRVKKQVHQVQFITLPKQAMFGYTKIDYKGYSIWVADVEKAIVDITYKYGPPHRPIRKMNEKKMRTYAERLGIPIEKLEVNQ
ncbi:MAG: type IV toxin-antitoxin system AbiEi family antitoxin domain-containing protein [Methanobacteriota archaeon]